MWQRTAELWASFAKDIVRRACASFDQMRVMGIRTVMITGDNPLTAAAIAQEAGVDDFLAQATPGQARSDQEGAGQRTVGRHDRATALTTRPRWRKRTWASP